MGFAYSLMEYAQESGRAGRDGKPARGVVIFSDVFLGQHICAIMEKGNDNDVSRERIRQFRSWALDTTTCRRSTLFPSLDEDTSPPCIVSGTDALCEVCSLALLSCTPPQVENVADSPNSAEELPSDPSKSPNMTPPGMMSTRMPRNDTRSQQAPATNNRAATVDLPQPKDSRSYLVQFRKDMRVLSKYCAYCLVHKQEKSTTCSECCLGGGACFNCLDVSGLHNHGNCPVAFDALHGQGKPTCRACGMNACAGMRLHKREK